ncbi:MAG: efflux RND transporter periplasmic adaptor subunit [Bacteroidota bacterium]|nr:efflux RND transporter periplasmic adaptor subunit [Bacteroidota bacterium]MDP3145853.1 efflux RND transporter periplasmic adaptor subunit [Bacteroidota bacterium]MDP3558487.1 efflux RND transporter periplasmic adaptor subunit [Bacteroidota bacterium]
MKNILLIFIGVLIMTSCGGEKIQEKELNPTEIENNVTLTEAQFKNANILLGKIENRNISTTLKLNGKIDVPPQNMVSVSMPLGGFLKTTKLLPGMHIKKGEVIATMEDQQYIQLQQEYLTAKSKLAFAENEFKRQKELNSSKASSDKIYQQSEMDYNTQKINLSALSEKLRLININPEILNENNLSRSVNVYSSIDGFVSKVNVNIGKYVNPSDILFELINPSDIHLNLKVFEKDLDKLSIGQKLLAYNNNQPDKKHPCEIILISRDLSADRSAEVHCHFEDYDKTLLPGMYMNAEVELKISNTQSINEDAIVSFEGKDFVFVSKGNNNFELLEIKKGASENNFTELISLEGKNISNNTFVIKGAYSLLMQLKNKSED